MLTAPKSRDPVILPVILPRMFFVNTNSHNASGHKTNRHSTSRHNTNRCETWTRSTRSVTTRTVTTRTVTTGEGPEVGGRHRYRLFRVRGPGVAFRGLACGLRGQAQAVCCHRSDGGDGGAFDRLRDNLFSGILLVVVMNIDNKCCIDGYR